jgi:hypothetical protein
VLDCEHWLIRMQAQDVHCADALTLPYRSASLDGAISIAVLHHLSNVRHYITRSTAEYLLRESNAATAFANAPTACRPFVGCAAEECPHRPSGAARPLKGIAA